MLRLRLRLQWWDGCDGYGVDADDNDVHKGGREDADDDCGESADNDIKNITMHRIRHCSASWAMMLTMIVTDDDYNNDSNNNSDLYVPNSTASCPQDIPTSSNL